MEDIIIIISRQEVDKACNCSRLVVLGTGLDLFLCLYSISILSHQHIYRLKSVLVTISYYFDLI